MKRVLLLASFILTIITTQAQNEGSAVAMDRFERNNSLFLSAGPAFTLGKNLGDYSNGFSLEVGYLKRINRLLSIGPAISYNKFKYDKNKTHPYYYDPETFTEYNVKLRDGDVNLVSLGLTLKLNFIPVSDNSKFSFYGLTTPFVCNAIRKEMSSHGEIAVYNGEGYEFYEFELKADQFDGFKKKSNITGGIHAGFGLEFLPAKPVSFFAQATFSYTMPIHFVSSQEYTEKAYNNGEYETAQNGDIYYETTNTIGKDEYPNVKKGFSAVNIRLGVTFNF